ncbi:hypothetical protein DL766_007814 [Monosporascus sp. MC13-8B]|uniref:SMP domain-containing protein n=1 Tax=Monosporascus cannonballus TaxID=155416 RepID=A0ABY0H2Q6_9PEZI|nr:hypothetical protein DL762_007655 [Monosporascus cannonballus]RYO98560.1 hypothetical protein DL763_002090 [Monosporascus cannonballus]RYP21965.1 hypothetical protein DL766_007814 [Monosporascus sp. MC13-8B]
MAVKAQDLLDAADQAADSEKPHEEEGRTEMPGHYLAEAAQATLSEAGEVVGKLRVPKRPLPDLRRPRQRTKRRGQRPRRMPRYENARN